MMARMMDGCMEEGREKVVERGGGSGLKYNEDGTESNVLHEDKN